MTFPPSPPVDLDNTSSAQQKAATLRELHVPGQPLVLPNVWDAASATMVTNAGFPVIATSSAATASVLGYADGEATPVEEVLAAASRRRARELRAEPAAAVVRQVRHRPVRGARLR